jgi:hypothetical protein
MTRVRTHYLNILEMSTQTITQPICSQSFADVHDTFNSDMIAVNFIVEENHSSPKTVADKIYHLQLCPLHLTTVGI